jgi:hypothetical protein
MDKNLYIYYWENSIIFPLPLICEDFSSQTSQDYERIEEFPIKTEDLYREISKKVIESLANIRIVPKQIIYDKSYQSPSLLNLWIKKFSTFDKKHLGMCSITICDDKKDTTHVVGYQKIRGGHQGIKESYSLVALDNIEDLAKAIEKALTISVANYR